MDLNVAICNMDFTDNKIAAAVLETAKRVRNTLPNNPVHVALPQMIDGVDFKSEDTRRAVITIVDCSDLSIQNRIVHEFMLQLISSGVETNEPFHFE